MINLEAVSWLRQRSSCHGRESARPYQLSPRQFLGVQRAQPFAGVRGVPEKLLFPFLPPQAATKEKPFPLIII